MGKPHDDWLDAVQADVARDYDRIRRLLSEGGAQRIQQSGHAGESTWARFLGDWLPQKYEVGTRKYIVTEGEEPEFETDIILFRPDYPARLREREVVLALGVAAAFSVKLTLKADGITEAVQAARSLADRIKSGEGTPRHQLMTPFPYALLAHSHDWRKASSTPAKNVDRIIEEAEKGHLEHPRQHLDALCVADLGAWTRGYSSRMPALIPQGHSQESFEYGYVNAPFMRHMGEKPSPIAVLLTWLYSRLAQDDPALQPLAQGFGRLLPSNAGGVSRQWELREVYSEDVFRRLVSMQYDPTHADWQIFFR